eukprot:scaffold208251_cov30-Tisochrysis_lutea.AAC.5
MAGRGTPANCAWGLPEMLVIAPLALPMKLQFRHGSKYAGHLGWHELVRRHPHANAASAPPGYEGVARRG